jgi:hypothetical protein
MNEYMDETPVFRGEFAFSYKTALQHAREFLSTPLPIVGAAIAIFGGFWTFGEASIQFLQANPRGWTSYCILIAASIIGSFTWNAYLYYQKVPQGLESVSKYAQRIAHWQRPLWEFRLAKALLAERIGPFNQELRDLNAGRVFVIAEKPESLQAYIRWAQSRFDNLFNMRTVAERLLLNDFPAALQSTADHPADPAKILMAVDTLARFYGDTVTFERSSRSVIPIEELSSLHKHQLGWSEPIRDAVHQMFRFLQQMCECDPNTDNRIKFAIVFDEPPGVTQYREELSRLESRLTELESNW